ncbi:hypothetical protein LP421_08060 [Rhizobium sp. RCAM05350]|nr:hypothetical protein LP421_08060 [Rhizobium sp. RCAM05350]
MPQHAELSANGKFERRLAILLFLVGAQTHFNDLRRGAPAKERRAK